MSKIWLTSDLHFNHDKDFIWGARGFSSVKEMNETQVKKYNEVVSNEDTVYILGDSMMGMDMKAGLALLRRLKGTKYLVIGNHDTDARIEAYKTSGIFADVQFAYRLKYKGHTCLLTHYPTITANGDDLRTLNMFGHTHQKDNFFENRPYMYHVGVDSHDCYPVLLEDVVNTLRAKVKGEK